MLDARIVEKWLVDKPNTVKNPGLLTKHATLKAGLNAEKDKIVKLQAFEKSFWRSWRSWQPKVFRGPASL